MTWQGEVLCDGAATGEVLCLDAPISFWGGISTETARVTLAGHPQFDQSVAGRILIIPQLVGSSSSSAVLLELIYRGRAPLALVLGRRDAILPVGVLVAQQMGWGGLPVLLLADPPVTTGQVVDIRAGGLLLRGGA
jgi:predicted aconitase with swiveling domain